MIPSNISVPIAAVTICMLALVPFASAENGGGAQYKIGVVDIKEVFDNYDKQKKEYAALREKRDEAQKPIDGLSDQITKDRERYDAEAETMTEEDRRALEEKIEAAFTRYRAEFERSQKDIERQENKLLRELLEDIHLAIQEIGAKHNYHLIFESGQNSPASLTGRNGGLLYHSTTLNMTQRVIDELNSKD